MARRRARKTEPRSKAETTEPVPAAAESSEEPKATARAGSSAPPEDQREPEPSAEQERPARRADPLAEEARGSGQDPAAKAAPDAEPEAPTGRGRDDGHSKDVATRADGADLGLVEADVDEQYLTFLIAGEEYGIGILRAREILEFQTLTRVPTTPPWVRGVMNLRGSVVPVIDLALKFGMAETAVTTRTCVVVVETDFDGESTVMGIMADSVNQVVALSQDQIEEPPAFGTRIDVSFLHGMGRTEDRFALILDIDRVLSAEELLSGPVAAINAAEQTEGPEEASEAEEATRELSSDS